MTLKHTATALLILAALLAGAPRALAQEQKQVNVSVKIIEFQTTKNTETGLSAYFKQRNEPRPYGRISSGNGAVTAADLTFPAPVGSGLTVFLDNLSSSYGDFEVVLQALVDQNRAFILSQPKVMVPVGEATPTLIKTSQEVPYENTVVVGASAVQTTAFRPTGVSLSVSALQVVDDDGDPMTTEDIYYQLKLTAEIAEEGQRITVALDSSSPTSATKNSTAISVPEFVSRSVDTTVWVRNGQVLIMGGLYRNSTTNNTATLPWLTQGEDILSNAVSRAVPFAQNATVPITAGLGNTSRADGRRELVFLVKADLWRKAFTVADDFGFTEEEEGEKTPARPRTPADVITGVLENITDISQGVTVGIGGAAPGETLSGSLGGAK